MNIIKMFETKRVQRLFGDQNVMHLNQTMSQQRLINV